MHDDMVMTRWKHLTDKVKSLWAHPAEEEDRQAAPLAAWEDEGGRTSTSAEAPLRKV